MSAATITSKGQITLPKAVRDRLELGPGDRVDFVLAPDGRFDLIPVKASIKSLQGCVPAPAKPVTIEAMAKAVRARAKRFAS
ncbi:MAG: AbrB/MazE/SpoVT family DNA-binding domain-containing protein [Pseudoxanthomonas sp.]|nr:AbrB/MazE/SpoVT family DNA-binding domain-containing protein [Pseudoxanthomonas sp.]